MDLDDETTAYELHTLLVGKWYSLSLRIILRCRSSLGWTFRGGAYCQLIPDENKKKRIDHNLTDGIVAGRRTTSLTKT